jgi:CHAD domain-containing protein
VPAIDDLRALLERQLRAIERTSPGVLEGSDPEDLHRFRVATRRSRSLIRASRPLIRDQLAGVDRELRWLGGVSGPVRDLDVLIEQLRSLLPALDPDQAGAEAIVAALERERLRQRESLLAALAGARFPALLARFSEALAELRVRDAGVSLVGLAHREAERFDAAYEELGERPGDDELHALRIRAKHARYAAELAALGEGDPLATLADALRDVQDLIGAHQDAVVAEQRVRALATDESRLAAGRIVELGRSVKAAARADLPAAVARVERAAEHAFHGPGQ